MIVTILNVLDALPLLPPLPLFFFLLVHCHDRLRCRNILRKHLLVLLFCCRCFSFLGEEYENYRKKYFTVCSLYPSHQKKKKIEIHLHLACYLYIYSHCLIQSNFTFQNIVIYNIQSNKLCM